MNNAAESPFVTDPAELRARRAAGNHNVFVNRRNACVAALMAMGDLTMMRLSSALACAETDDLGALLVIAKAALRPLVLDDGHDATPERKARHFAAKTAMRAVSALWEVCP